MQYRFYIALIFCSCFFLKTYSQIPDSIHIYALYMKSVYTIKIDKGLIKNEVEPISIKNKDTIHEISRIVENSVKGKYIKKIKSNNLEIRLSFEFFYKGKVAKLIGVTPYEKMFINHSLYHYDKSKLKYLDKFIPGLTEILGVK